MRQSDPTKESGSTSERIREKLKLAYYDKIAPDIEAVLAERDLLREEVTNLRSRERRTSSEGAKRSKALRAERDALRVALQRISDRGQRYDHNTAEVGSVAECGDIAREALERHP